MALVVISQAFVTLISCYIYHLLWLPIKYIFSIYFNRNVIYIWMENKTLKYDALLLCCCFFPLPWIDKIFVYGRLLFNNFFEISRVPSFFVWTKILQLSLLVFVCLCLKHVEPGGCKSHKILRSFTSIGLELLWKRWQPV